MLNPELVQITRQSKISEDEFYLLITTMFEKIWQNLLPLQIITNGLSVKRASNVITPPETPIPDCLTCGVCCAAMLCVGVRPHEEFDPEEYWDITIKDEDGEIIIDRYLRRDAETLACAFLHIQADEPRICKIYKRRPQMCRDFEAGSDKCHALRRAYGLEPFLTLEEMSEALEKLDHRIIKSAPSETIREVKFVETKTRELEIMAYLKDNSTKIIHVFDPQLETWRQFEFDGLTLSEAKDLIDSRILTSSKRRK